MYDYLAHQFWWRHVSGNGQISLGGHHYGVGTPYADQDVRIDFDADTAHFVARLSNNQVIKRFPPDKLTAALITGLDLKST